MFNIFRREGLTPGIEQLGPLEAFKKLISPEEGKNAVVIDVREPDEFRGKLGHIENSELIPLRLLPLKVKELEKYKDKEIIVVCHSGARSYSAAIILKRHGFASVFNLSGGMLLWKKHGLKSSL